MQRGKVQNVGLLILYHGRSPLLFPQTLKPRRVKRGIPDCVFDRLVAEILLYQPCVRTFGRERVAATVSQHMVVKFYFKLGELCDRRECFRHTVAGQH